MNISHVRLFVVGGVLAAAAAAWNARAQSSAAPDAGATNTGRYSYTAASVTVTDNQTHLVWQRNVPSTTINYAAAKAYCVDPALATSLGGSGWRLPTAKELLTLADYSRTTGVDPAVFPTTVFGYYWSASAVTQGGGFVWAAALGVGSLHEMVMIDTGLVRCVR
jgi:hypothetical protein